jgi:serine/threonine-protein kinase RsbT
LPTSTRKSSSADAKSPEAGAEIRVPVRSDIDLVYARHQGRQLAESLDFSSSEATLVATAISELARNIVNYAVRGEIILRRVHDQARRGITVIARDEGPGIANVKLALQEGYSTSGGLGLGLPGVRRIMDEFHIETEPGRGTTVTVSKWKQ